MAHNLNEAGFTQVGNKIIAALVGSPLNRLELCIVLILERQTAGYHRVSAPLPLTFICDAVYAKKQNVSFALKELIRKKVLIEITQTTNRNARVLAINENISEWDFGKTKSDEKDSESSALIPKEKPEPESSGSLLQSHKVNDSRVISSMTPGSSGRLPQSHHCDDPLNINKYKNKKEAAAVVNNKPGGSLFHRQKTATAAAAGISSPEKENTQEESIQPLFRLVFCRNPNPIEKEELENLLKEDSRFTYNEAFSIYTESIRIAAISSPERKNVRYLIGTIRSKMRDELVRREKAASAGGKPVIAVKSEKPEWEEGAFIRMWEEAEGKKFYTHSNEKIQSFASSPAFSAGP